MHFTFCNNPPNFNNMLILGVLQYHYDEFYSEKAHFNYKLLPFIYLRTGLKPRATIFAEPMALNKKRKIVGAYRIRPGAHSSKFYYRQ